MKTAKAYAAVNDLYVSSFHIRGYARDVRKSVGLMHRWPDEPWELGWNRARKDGWKVRRVTVTVDPLSSDDTP